MVIFVTLETPMYKYSHVWNITVDNTNKATIKHRCFAVPKPHYRCKPNPYVRLQTVSNHYIKFPHEASIISVFPSCAHILSMLIVSAMFLSPTEQTEEKVTCTCTTQRYITLHYVTLQSQLLNTLRTG